MCHEDHEDTAPPLRFVEIWGGRIIGRPISVSAWRRACDPNGRVLPKSGDPRPPGSPGAEVTSTLASSLARRAGRAF